MTDEKEVTEKSGYKTLNCVVGKYYIERMVEHDGPGGASIIRIIAVGNKGLDALCEKYDNQRYALPYFQEWRKVLSKGAGKWTSWHHITMVEEQWLKISTGRN